MKSYTITADQATDIFESDLKLKSFLPHAGRAPGFKREPSFCENFPHSNITGQPAASRESFLKISPLSDEIEPAHAIGGHGTRLAKKSTAAYYFGKATPTPMALNLHLITPAKAHAALESQRRHPAPHSPACKLTFFPARAWNPTVCTTTPMMAQYEEVRSGLPPNTLLFFRLGDFYELFNEDAERASKLLGLTLTHRQSAPMAGVPYHAANGYVKKLLDAGWRVAICDQLEPPVPGKIVRRALTRIYSPGTVIEDEQMEAREHQYILAFDIGKDGIVAAWLELSTGELRISFSADVGELLAILSALAPKEVLIPEGARDAWHSKGNIWFETFQALAAQRLTSELPVSCFGEINAQKMVRETLGVLSLAGFSIDDRHPALRAAGALLHYVGQSLCARPKNIHRIREVRFDQSLIIDGATLRNLEIFHSVRHTREGSLLAALDRTETAAGARLLREYLARPLLHEEEIVRRQTCVGEFLQNQAVADAFRSTLGQTRDLLRMLGRLHNRVRNPRDVGGILETLEKLPRLQTLLGQLDGKWLRAMGEALGDFSELCAVLGQALADHLPNDLSDGGYIRDGYNETLDRYRDILSSSERWLSQWEADEQRATGIRTLRIKNNGTFGYFIEVSKSYLNMVPGHYIRRQTVANGERYITEALREKEREILDAQRNAAGLEREIFEEIVQRVLRESEKISNAAHILAELDVFAGWAAVARNWNYTCPQVDTGNAIDIKGGRHPVLEQLIARQSTGLAGAQHFVENDAHLSNDERQILLLTGPNMGGKSTFIRQVALITIMARCGCWVPAQSARIGRIDRIFSRIGAGDDLSQGRSTFMVEMHETAAILHLATPNSLVILDEIGRGTSTYDGLSIAWAVVEYLHGDGACGPITLFATHYHEITRLEGTLPRVHNFHAAVQEEDDEILFLRKVRPGCANRSYGIQVAKLVGLPASLIARAKVILNDLEQF
jgi:DNA mismatch repair protein MutS